jgi:hypothetical protein
MRLPSIAVTMLAVSPGVLSKIEVVEPPYLGRDRQQHGDGHRGTDARQHADCRAQRAAHKTPEQINGRGGSDKALHQLVKDFHKDLA